MNSTAAACPPWPSADLVYPTFATWLQKRRRRSTTALAFAEVIVEGPAKVSVTTSAGLLWAGSVTLQMSGREHLPLAVELIRALAPIHHADPFRQPQSAKRRGHEPCAYLKDVLEQLPGMKNTDDLDALLPVTWYPAGQTIECLLAVT